MQSGKQIIIINAILLGIDCGIMNNAEYKMKYRAYMIGTLLIGVIVIPIYLFNRARVMKKQPYCFVIWIVLGVLSILVPIVLEAYETSENNNRIMTVKLGHLDVYQDTTIVNMVDAFDEYGEIDPRYWVQISCVDLDRDGVKEVIVSIGDKLVEMETAIFTPLVYTPNGPFGLAGIMDGQTKMWISDQNTIVAPYGSVGLFCEYQYSQGIVTQLNP